MTRRVLAMPGNALAGESISTAHLPAGLTTCVVRALRRLCLTEKELAAVLRLSEGVWSRQRTGQDGHYMQVQRLDILPPELHARFLDALIDELALLRGKTVAAPAAGHLPKVAEAMRAMADAVDAMATASQEALPLSDRRIG